MMTEAKKCWKLTECVAHTPGSVTCLSLGQLTGSILATGGDDKMVKLWVVGRTSCIMSLAGHTASVESLRFNSKEDKLAAGSLSGVIKIWDLNEAKLMRSLSSHKAAVSCLDLHPFGDFAVSGCADGSAKLWDIRRKGCIYTYKGHTEPLTCVKFSPDGRWVVTAGQDSVIKIWDLEAGKIQAEFVELSAGATDLSFHPSVLLMAAAFQDKTVRFLDLELFQSIGSTLETDMPTPPRRIAFNPDGNSVYASCGDTLKIINVEPTALLETVPVGWGRLTLADLVVSARHNQLIGAGFAHSSVVTYVVDVKSCAPYVTPAPAQAAAVLSPPDKDRPTTTSGRKSFNQPEPNLVPKTKTSKKKAALAGGAGAASVDEESSEMQIHDPEAYNDIFAPKRALRRSPSPPSSSSGAGAGASRPAHAFAAAAAKPFTPPTKESPTKPPDGDQRRAAPEPASPPPQPEPRQQPPQPSPPQQQPPPTRDRARSREHRAEAAAAAVTPTPRNNGGAPAAVSVSVSDFLPQQQQPPQQPAESDEDLVSKFRHPHQSFMSVIGARERHLRRVRSMWSADTVKTAVDCALLIQDSAVLIDLLNVLTANQSLWTLDISAALLPAIRDLFNSKHASYVETGATAALLVLRQFSTLIKSTLSAHGLSPGVDLSREDRAQRCRVCYDCLMQISSALASPDTLSKAGQTGRELKMFLLQLQL
ncbi:hypothetical protein BOX15_Mlig018822g1 [Macrostomum lignano]|uniref:Katanin p80 WD40 repeat-containing subunit B1 n=1 Tax=Macrostomum lignano TaxID=282301 RepID=A0A267GHQ3_9PLAT|nr:hypothetical protein BOX15_Mlig018822g1 [Macrostomum lignano]